MPKKKAVSPVLAKLRAAWALKKQGRQIDLDKFTTVLCWKCGTHMLKSQAIEDGPEVYRHEVDCMADPEEVKASGTDLGDIYHCYVCNQVTSDSSRVRVINKKAGLCVCKKCDTMTPEDIEHIYNHKEDDTHGRRNQNHNQQKDRKHKDGGHRVSGAAVRQRHR